MKGNIEVCKALIANGAPLDQIFRDETALIIAAKFGKTEVCKSLIDAGSSVNLRNSINYSALTFALKKDDTELVRSLLAAGAEITEEDKAWIKPMMRKKLNL